MSHFPAGGAISKSHPHRRLRARWRAAPDGEKQPPLGLLKDLRLRFSRLPGVPAPPPPHPSDHDPLVAAGTPAAARVESLGHATELRAPGDVFLEALLGFLCDADSLSARLFPEACDATGRGAFLLFRRGPDVQLGQGPVPQDLVILEGDLRSREPAVREPACKPTFDRSELFFIHVLHNYTVMYQVSSRFP